MEEIIKLKKLFTEDKLQLEEIRKIYENSFPPNERRDFKKILALLPDSRFNLAAILSGEEVVGLISTWNFNTFAYIEHFAVSTAFRGNGFGSYVLKTFIQNIDIPVVLEVEIPADDYSFKRIAFYERYGFKVCKEDYVQPPYDEGKEAVPMLIMCNRDADHSLPFEQIVETLHRQVYGYFDVLMR